MIENYFIKSKFFLKIKLFLIRVRYHSSKNKKKKVLHN